MPRDAGVMPHFTRPRPVAPVVQPGGDPLCPIALMHILIENDTNDVGLSFVDSQFIEFMFAFIKASAFYKIIAVWGEPALEASVLYELAQGGFGTD